MAGQGAGSFDGGGKGRPGVVRQVAPPGPFRILPAMSKRETQRRQREQQRQQTEAKRRLRDESLQSLHDTAYAAGRQVVALHYRLMLEQWKLIDDSFEYLEQENAALSKDYRRRSILSLILAAMAVVLLLPWVLGWLLG